MDGMNGCLGWICAHSHTKKDVNEFVREVKGPQLELESRSGNDVLSVAEAP